MPARHFAASRAVARGVALASPPLSRDSPGRGARVVVSLDETLGATDAAEMRRHLLSHRRAWLLVVVVVVVVNEVVDRNFFDHREHIDGDFVLALVALIVGFFGSYLLARRGARGIA
jgi:DNA-binding PucR family transcriptional regulator